MMAGMRMVVFFVGFILSSASAAEVVPDAPTLLGVNCSWNSASVAWRPQSDDGAPMLNYIVQYNSSFTPDTWQEANVTIPADARKSKVSMSKFGAWANYTFRVIAKNKVGRSLPSSPSKVFCSTPAKVPDKNPEGVKITGIDDSSASITWKAMPPIEQNGPGFFYRVYSRKADRDDDDWLTVGLYNWEDTELVVGNIPPYTLYIVKVEAHNDKGEARTPAAEVQGYPIEGVPLEAPKDLSHIRMIDDKTAEISWKPVPPESLRGELKGYKIETKTRTGQWREIKVQPSVTKAEVSALVPNAENLIRVKAFNGLYDGPVSDTISIFTEEGTPGPVTEFEAHVLNSSTVNLVWKEPVEKNGVLTGYLITYYRILGTMHNRHPHPDLEISDSRITNVTLLDLDPETEYRVSIAAKTRKGPGASHFIEFETPDKSVTLPNKPHFDLRAVKATNAGAGIAIMLRPITGYPGTHFFVRLRKKGGTAFTRYDNHPIRYSEGVLVPQLDPGVVYQVQVVAISGPLMTPSDLIEITTSGLTPEAVKNLFQGYLSRMYERMLSAFHVKP